jgi:hypothetical protein
MAHSPGVVVVQGKRERERRKRTSHASSRADPRSVGLQLAYVLYVLDVMYVLYVLDVMCWM